MLKLTHISKTFNPGTVNAKTALRDLSLTLNDGDFVTVIGGNGAGKSTMLNAIAGAFPVDSGSITIDGKNITSLPEYKRAAFIGRVFQDPMMGTAATMGIEENLALAYRRGQRRGLHAGITNEERKLYREKLATLGLGLEDRMTSKVGLLSGGQRQRICIARALSLKPQIIVADECVAALDVSIRAQVVNLMMELQEEMGLSYIFISHDMGVVERISHRVAVMYLGQIVEMGSRRAVLGNPLHPYTQKLLSAVPIADPQERNLLKLLNLSDLPSPVRKVGDDPVIEPLVEVEPGHFVAKHVVGTMEGHK